MDRKWFMLLSLAIWFTPWSITTAQETGEVVSLVEYDFLKSFPQLSWGKDPFLRKPGVSNNSKSDRRLDFNLSGVIFDEESPVAIINGRLVRRGDLLNDGSRVAIIGKNYVVLEKGSSLIELPLISGSGSRR